ncbi:MAG: cytochrome c3 family protein, partial [Deltaproteobacteria bacterium]
MKKMMICTAAFAFLFSLSMAGMSFAAEDNGPAEITLTTKDAKKPAVFPHHKHQEFLKCAQCHEAPNFPKGVAF